MMKPIITKTGMVLAVAATAALPNLAAAADGWDYSGAHARASALQLDYFSLDGDIGNIWVNPALAKQYSNTMELSITDDDRQDINRADSNVGRSGAGTNNGGVAGILHGVSDATTVGAYIGRDRADMAGYDIADALNDGDLGAPGAAENPQNQFDIFYGVGLDNMDIGVRFNYQAKEDTTSGPRDVSVNSGVIGNMNNVTIGTVVEVVTADYAANNPNATTPVNLTNEIGDYEETTTRTSSGWDASEMNIALGFNLGDGIDGSIQMGSADGSLGTSTSEVVDKREYIRNQANTADILTDLGRRTTNMSDQVDIDSGSSMALALRYQLSDAWLTSVGYESFDNGGKLTRSTVSSETFNTIDPLTGAVTATSSQVNNEVQTGTSVREGSALSLNAAYQIKPTDTSTVTIASGLRTEDRDTGYSLTASRDNTVDTDTAGVVTTTYNAPLGTNEKYMEEESAFMIPLTVALEHGLNDKWERWTLRGSVSKNIYQSVETKMTDYYYVDIDPTLDTNMDPVDGGRWVQQFSETVTNEEVWADRETTVRLGFGYTRGNFTVDTVLSATVDRLFTADHKILEDSKFGKVTVAYNY